MLPYLSYFEFRIKHIKFNKKKIIPDFFMHILKKERMVFILQQQNWWCGAVNVNKYWGFLSCVVCYFTLFKWRRLNYQTLLTERHPFYHQTCRCTLAVVVVVKNQNHLTLQRNFYTELLLLFGTLRFILKTPMWVVLIQLSFTGKKNKEVDGVFFI